MLDLAVHEIDLLRFVLRREIVEAHACASGGEEADTASLLLELEGGVQAQLLASQRSVDEAVLEVYGRRGKLGVDRHADLLRVSGTRASALAARLADTARDAVSFPRLLRRRHEPYSEPAFRAALAHFVGAVRGAWPASPDLEDGLRALEVAAAAEASLAEDRAVEVARG